MVEDARGEGVFKDAFGVVFVDVGGKLVEVFKDRL
jgi:hypothetical protein